MQERMASLAWIAVLVAIGALVCVGLWQTSGADPMLIGFKRSAEGIMGTDTDVSVVVPADHYDQAVKALDAAEHALRSVETNMSVHLEFSGISRLNASVPGEPVFLPADTLELLSQAQRLTVQTQGTMDPTCAPLFALWKSCAKDGRRPTVEELAQADQASGWRHFDIQHDAVIRSHADARVDLGAVAKGWAVDKAVAAMKANGVRGGLVNAGGDIRCFGTDMYGKPWLVSVKDPFDPDKGGMLCRLRLSNMAICTSGNYYRFSEIKGERLSHIVDPRTGLPADAAPSVTVVAPTAITADAWATALSVTGPQGLGMLPDGAEAMLVVGTKDNYQMITSPGFNALLEADAKASAIVAKP